MKMTRKITQEVPNEGLRLLGEYTAVHALYQTLSRLPTNPRWEKRYPLRNGINGLLELNKRSPTLLSNGTKKTLSNISTGIHFPRTSVILLHKRSSASLPVRPWMILVGRGSLQPDLDDNTELYASLECMEPVCTVFTDYASKP